MSTYDKIAWLPLCGGLTGLGLVLSYLAMRRRGISSGLRGAAWSLLPLAAYLTGAIAMFWKIGVAIGDFATGFAFSARVWSGIALAGVAVFLLIVSGGLRRRRGVKRKKDTPAAAAADGATGSLPAAGSRQLSTRAATSPVPAQAPVKARKGKAADRDDDDDLGDVADILRRHGIT
ncbi:MAG: cellulose synthase [Streptosporangiaceae bacterium]|jgi:hypothetical protein